MSRRDGDTFSYQIVRLMVEKDFGDLIALGVGTSDQFAALYRHYLGRHPNSSMRRVSDQLRADVEVWMNERAASYLERRPTITVREL